MQLNIATILRLHKKHNKRDNIDESFKQLLCECQTTLQYLVDAYYNKDMTNSQHSNQNVVHDLTRCPSIFPRMFVIILGSASAFTQSYQNENDRFNVSQINTNATVLIKYGANLFHPQIVTALKVLVRATSFSINENALETNIHDILECCFLLPTLAIK